MTHATFFCLLLSASLFAGASLYLDAVQSLVTDCGYWSIRGSALLHEARVDHSGFSAGSMCSGVGGDGRRPKIWGTGCPASPHDESQSSRLSENNTLVLVLEIMGQSPGFYPLDYPETDRSHTPLSTAVSHKGPNGLDRSPRLPCPTAITSKRDLVQMGCSR